MEHLLTSRNVTARRCRNRYSSPQDVVASNAPAVVLTHARPDTLFAVASLVVVLEHARPAALPAPASQLAMVLAYAGPAGLFGGASKIETRLIIVDERFAIVMGECLI